MYKRNGAPAEKVLTFLTSLRTRLQKRDQENLDWMMEVIAGEELYSTAEFDEDQLLNMQAQHAGVATNKDAQAESTKRRKESFSVC